MIVKKTRTIWPFLIITKKIFIFKKAKVEANVVMLRKYATLTFQETELGCKVHFTWKEDH